MELDLSQIASEVNHHGYLEVTHLSRLNYTAQIDYRGGEEGYNLKFLKKIDQNIFS